MLSGYIDVTNTKATEEPGDPKLILPTPLPVRRLLQPAAIVKRGL